MRQGPWYWLLGPVSASAQPAGGAACEGVPGGCAHGLPRSPAGSVAVPGYGRLLGYVCGRPARG